MKIKFEIYATLIKEVKELSEKLTDNMKSFGYNQEIKIGWKIGEVTVTLPKDISKHEIKKKIEEIWNRKVPKQKIWLKEVSYGKK